MCNVTASLLEIGPPAERENSIDKDNHPVDFTMRLKHVDLGFCSDLCK
jgi:hypothetical protein